MLKIKSPKDGLPPNYMRFVITGLPMSGKTFSSILLAAGLTNFGKVLLLDCENGRSIRKTRNTELLKLTNGWAPDVVDLSDYAKEIDFDLFEEVLKTAISSKYDLVIFDSLSIPWGNVYKNFSEEEDRKTNRYVKWGKVKDHYESFSRLWLQAKISSITTVLSKKVPEDSGYRNVQGSGGKTSYGIKYICPPDIWKFLDFVLDLTPHKNFEGEVLRSDIGSFPVGKRVRMTLDLAKEFRLYLENLSVSPEELKRSDYIGRIRVLLEGLPEDKRGMFLGDLSQESFLDSLKTLPLDEVVSVGKRIKELSV